MGAPRAFVDVERRELGITQGAMRVDGEQAGLSRLPLRSTVVEPSFAGASPTSS